MEHPSVCVMIAAYKAEDTIGMAVASALAEPEVAEVVVVDDASPDGTSDAAKAADDGTGRLRVERRDRNAGPSAARNHAIQVSSSPFLAVLDADDIILRGRFRNIMALAPFDLAADNVLFFQQDTGAPSSVPEASRIDTIDARAYVLGNISRRGKNRAELGFLKPVLSRAFLDTHKLRYNEAMWLGEDYELALRMLLCGAVFRVSHKPGYGAMVRANSLSAEHSTRDLWVQAAAERAMIATYAPSPPVRVAMQARARQIEYKAALRAALDAKQEAGYLGALKYTLAHPGQAWPIFTGVLGDKLRPAPKDRASRRYLMSLD